MAACGGSLPWALAGSRSKYRFRDKFLKRAVSLGWVTGEARLERRLPAPGAVTACVARYCVKGSTGGVGPKWIGIQDSATTCSRRLDRLACNGQKKRRVPTKKIGRGSLIEGNP